MGLGNAVRTLFDDMTGRSYDAEQYKQVVDRRLDEMKADRIKGEDAFFIKRFTKMIGDTIQQVVTEGVVNNNNKVPKKLEQSNTGPFIDGNTVLVIPEHVRTGTLFFDINRGKKEILLSEIHKLSMLDRKKVIAMLKSEVCIKNGDNCINIELDKVLSIGTQRITIKQYILSQHQSDYWNIPA